MLRLHIIEDVFSEKEELLEVEDLCKALSERWEAFPPSARIYHGAVSKLTDVTPFDKASILALSKLTGDVFVLVYPEGFVPLDFLAIMAFSFAASFVMNMLFPAKVPNQERNVQKRSPNNAFSARINTERINGRIPDIFGTEWSTPDLISLPYVEFVNNREVEICNMCISRGSLTIHKVLEDTTPFSDISAASLGIYGPNTSANSGDAPKYTIGDFTPTPIIMAKRSNSVNGQTLRAPNENRVVGNLDMTFVWPDSVYYSGSDVDFTDYFDADDELVITNGNAKVDGTSYDFGGTFTILSVTSNTVVLVNPALINANWGLAIFETIGESDPASPTLQVFADQWTDAATLDEPTLTGVYANVVAMNGLYADAGDNQAAVNVEVELELTPVNSAGDAIGPAEFFSATVYGSAVDHQMKGVTIKAEPTFTGRCKARMRRVTDKDLDYTALMVDEVKFRDLYAVAAVSQEHFGNVTTVQTKIPATLSALAIKERKSKILVTRNLPSRIGETSTFTTALTPTDSAADILCAICLDPYIGGRDISELDVASIYDTVDEVKTYFGTGLATQWGGTFSDPNLSFEETVSIICNATFCRAHRRWSTIKLMAEKQNSNSVLLFNHRNKLPRSETRTYSFGTLEKYDGVEVDWVDPDDGAIVTYYLPADQSAINSQKIEALGVRNNVQAHFIAWRAYNKLLYRYVDTEFDATAEADLLVAGDRILNADNVRANTQDGEVLEVNGLVLTLSQPVIFELGKTYTVFLQLYDGTVEAIACTEGSDSNKIVLAAPTSLPLVTNDYAYARTTYMVTDDSSTTAAAFIVTELQPQNNLTLKVTASNYDDRYYANDTDFINNIVVEE